MAATPEIQAIAVARAASTGPLVTQSVGTRRQLRAPTLTLRG
jgi:hypothetical protein